MPRGLLPAAASRTWAPIDGDKRWVDVSVERHGWWRPWFWRLIERGAGGVVWSTDAGRSWTRRGAFRRLRATVEAIRANHEFMRGSEPDA